MTVSHLTQETFVLLAAGTLAEHDVEHLSRCPQCRSELEGWRLLAWGARASMEPAEAPSFESIIAPILPAGVALSREQHDGIHGRWTFGHALRVSVLLFAAHLRMLLRLVVPVVGVGVMIATAAAVRVPTGYASAVFATAVCLVALASALCVCVPSVESRTELFVTTPVPPSAVVLARAVLVFGLTLGAASLGSLVIADRVGISLGTVIGAWLGPSTLAGAVALLMSVWRSSAAAAVVGGGLWLLGTLTVTMHTGPTTTPHAQTPDLVGAGSRVLATVWTTSPLTLSMSALLVAVACFIAAPASRHRLQTGWRIVGN